MTLGRNLLAGLANSAWSALVGVAVVPFYLRYLGMEAYGLIGLFMTAQVMFQLLDMGMAPTMNREVARCSASGQLRDAGNLLHTLAVIYWNVAVCIAVLSVVLSPAIARHWLQASSLTPATTVNSLALMGLVIACRWPIGLYQGVLIGAQRQAIASGINMVMLSFSNLGAVLVLKYASPTLEAFFCWQAITGFTYALVIRFAAWNLLNDRSKRVFRADELKRIWKFSAGVSGIALTGVLFSQLDKLILTRTLKLEEFGQYTLASTIVGSLYMVVRPMFNVMYPKFSALVATRRTEELLSTYKLAIGLVGAAVFPLAMLFSFYGSELIHLWTGDADAAGRSGRTVVFLALGTALHGVMYIPYALQLSHGRTGLILKNNLILLVTLIPVVIYASLKHGPLGASVAWCVLHLFSAAIVNSQIQRSFFPHALKLFSVEVAVPVVISGASTYAAYKLIGASSLSESERLVSGVAVMGVVTACLLFRIAPVRQWLFRRSRLSQHTPS